MSPSRQISETVLSIDHIVPYWRNPRRVTDEAVNAVQESIRTYGYHQPIVVDSDNVIIIGHTRYVALRRLGITEVPVLIAHLPEDKVKELRLIDNRTHEFTSWEFELLAAELDDLDKNLMSHFFPETVETGFDQLVDTVAGAEEELASNIDTEAQFICPACFHSFAINVTLDAIRSGTLETEPAAQTEETGA